MALVKILPLVHYFIKNDEMFRAYASLCETRVTLPINVRTFLPYFYGNILIHVPEVFSTYTQKTKLNKWRNTIRHTSIDTDLHQVYRQCSYGFHSLENRWFGLIWHNFKISNTQWTLRFGAIFRIQRGVILLICTIRSLKFRDISFIVPRIRRRQLGYENGSDKKSRDCGMRISMVLSNCPKLKS